ncbi:RNA pyrophosphohydrolase [uncultured Shewanella sp.]|uniref:RNA pyrophosphohydrolase n=1 Tax=uncultured Shewanella sp. TaxID=173975 RepID=UPI00263018E5|nr:RNA pyrophosphohydrolase [uncultured Shewanella sp.]
MIDSDGFRANVGIIICNRFGQVMWARRYGQHSWQFPQGGVDEGESIEEAMYRELYEEVGLKPEHVKLLTSTRSWLRYRLPKRLIRQDSKPVCIGQKQKWFLLQLTCNESAINLNASGHPEFDDWRWVSYWYPVRQVVSFKRDVYRKVMKEFAVTALSLQLKESSHKRKGRRRSSFLKGV